MKARAGGQKMRTRFFQGPGASPLEDVVEPRNRRERRAKAAQQRQLGGKREDV